MHIFQHCECSGFKIVFPVERSALLRNGRETGAFCLGRSIGGGGGVRGRRPRAGRSPAGAGRMPANAAAPAYGAPSAKTELYFQPWYCFLQEQIFLIIIPSVYKEDGQRA